MIVSPATKSPIHLRSAAIAMNANLVRLPGLVPVFDRECIQKFVRNDSPIRKLPGTNMDLQSETHRQAALAGLSFQGSLTRRPIRIATSVTAGVHAGSDSASRFAASLGTAMSPVFVRNPRQVVLFRRESLHDVRPSGITFASPTIWTQVSSTSGIRNFES